MLDAYVQQINLKYPAAVISSADQLLANTEAERTEWTRAMANLVFPLYTLRDDHDMPDPTDQFSDRWAFTAGGVRFIGFHAGGDMSVGATDLAFIEAELIALGGLAPVLVCHKPMADEFLNPIAAGLGREELLTLLGAYHVPLYLSGHWHHDMIGQVIDGVETLDVTGPLAVGGHFQVLDIYASRIDIHAYTTANPFADQDPMITVPI